MSSCFSGLGTPEEAGESLVDAMRIRFGDGISLVSNAAFDINKSSRSVLIQDQSIGAVGGIFSICGRCTFAVVRMMVLTPLMIL